MSSVDLVLQAFKKLDPEDFRVLSTIEVNMSRYRYVPEDVISGFSELSERDLEYHLSRLSGSRLILRQIGSYPGYALNTAGYDCLAINALVRGNVLEALGKPLGVGKESDVYDALTPTGEKVAVKFHRLGRVSFRQTRRLRSYFGYQRHPSWLYQSRVAAEKEFEALNMVHSSGVSVPKPVSQNRHIVVMGMIEGAELVEFTDIPKPKKILNEILLNVRKAYLDAGVVHGDLSEFNIIFTPDRRVLLIDWPQFVRRDHYSSDFLLERDVSNVLRFFDRKHKTRMSLKDGLKYVRGE